MLLLGLSCINADKPAEAEKLILGCFHEYEENSDSDVPMCLGLVVVVAELYQKQGKLDHAEKMELKAIQGYNGAVGAGHHYSLDALNNLANKNKK